MSKKTKFRAYQEYNRSDISIDRADLIKRVGAFVIDMIVISISILLILLLMSMLDLISFSYVFYIFRLRTGLYESLDLFNSSKDIIIHIGTSLFFLGYFIILESKYSWGQTIGKKILNIEVVDSEGNQPSLWESFLRNSTKYFLRIPVIGIPFGILEILLLFNYSARTGDFIANTAVASGIYKGSFTEVDEGDGYRKK